jgi:hypothetical protein
MQHRYKFKDKVELNRMAFSVRTTGPEIYEVIRLMPPDVSGEFSYRIKAGSIERAVRESDIRKPVPRA